MLGARLRPGKRSAAFFAWVRALPKPRQKMSKRCGAKGAVRCKRRGLFTFSFSEREGFEPSVRIELVQRISNQPLSTTQPSLLCIEPSFNSIMCHWEGFAHRFAEGLGPLRCRPPPSAEKQP